MELSQLRQAKKSPQWTKITQILHILTNESIFINSSKIELDLLHTNTLVGAGGQLFNITLVCSEIGLGIKHCQGKMNFMSKFDPDPGQKLAPKIPFFLNWSIWGRGDIRFQV